MRRRAIEYAAHIRYFVLGTPYLVWSLVLVALAAGCGAAPAEPSNAALAEPTPAEPSLAQQIAAVRAGSETWILVEHTPLTDRDLATLRGLDRLAALCIDHPDSRITAEGIAALEELPALAHLRIRGGGIGDEALAAIAQLEGLKILNLPRGEFTAGGLGRLKELPHLEMLRFSSPHISDAGLPALAKMPSLTRLHLIDLPITDAGLAELATIDRLQSLYIDGGQISDVAWDELFRQRPKLHVHINQQHHDRDPNRHPH